MNEGLNRKSSDNARGYSLWLKADRSTSIEIQAAIDGLCKRLNAPHFSPHITLLGQLDSDEEAVRLKTHELANRTKPFEVVATEIDFQDVFFRSMFLKISETDALMDLNSAARKIFDRQADQPFFPHLSLLYSYESRLSKLQASNDVNLNLPKTFKITGMEIIRTFGQVQDWNLIQKIEL